MRFYAFRFDAMACTLDVDSSRPRIAGTLYYFSAKRERDAWVAGRDLPDHLDSYAIPCTKVQGEFRLPFEAASLPKGWRTFDATAYNQPILSKNLNPKCAA